jgi:hypothetical protein
MRPLATEFKKDGFDHKVIRRENMVALVEKKHRDHSLPSYEVVRIQTHEGYEIMGRYVEPSEFMPRTAEWGIHGFTYTDLEDAEKKFKSMLKSKPSTMKPLE